MRLWLSDQASRALKNLPPEDQTDCPEHGKQAYARAPRSLEEEKGSWMCGECLKLILEQDGALREEKRRQEDEAKEAKKAAKKATWEATEQTDEQLEEVLTRCKDSNQRVRDTHHAWREREQEREHAAQALAEARARLEEARLAVEQAELRLNASGEGLPTLQSALETERTQLDGLVVELSTALEAADQAWKAVPPRQRKKRDRRPRHAAVQIIVANKRWHERHGSVAPVSLLNHGRHEDGEEGAEASEVAAVEAEQV